MRNLSNDEIKLLTKMMEAFGEKIPTAIYARKSTEDLSKESLSTQVEYCQTFIEQSKEYLKFKKTYQEDNVSGMSIKGRDELQKLIQAVDDGFIKAVVINKWDRLSRNTTDLKNLRESFGKKGALIITIEDSGEMSAVANLQFEIMAAINQYYVHKISEDTKAVLISKTSKGHSGGGVANYGYQFDDENFLIIRSEEAIVVADIYDKFELGYSYNDIIEDLKNRNIKTRKGNDFTKSTLHSILTNVKYYGVYRYNRSDREQSQLTKKHFDEVWVEDGIEEPIVTKEQFEEVQKVIEARKKIHKDSDYLLSGIMECGECLSKMFGSSQSAGKGKERRRHYMCPKHEKKNGGTCKNVGIDALTIENQVKQSVLDTINAYLKSNFFDKSIIQDSLDSKVRLKKSLNKSINNLEAVKEEALNILLEYRSNQAIIKSAEKKIESITNELKNFDIKLKLVDETIKQYKMVLGKKTISSLDSKTLFKNEILTKQLLRIVVDCVVIGIEDIKIKILDK